MSSYAARLPLPAMTVEPLLNQPVQRFVCVVSSPLPTKRIWLVARSVVVVEVVKEIVVKVVVVVQVDTVVVCITQSFQPFLTTERSVDQ